jgi:hypothetical protein
LSVTLLILGCIFDHPVNSPVYTSSPIEAARGSHQPPWWSLHPRARRRSCPPWPLAWLHFESALQTAPLERRIQWGFPSNRLRQCL